MVKDFSLSNDNAMINFTVKYCTTHEELLTSNGFKKVTLAYLKTLEKRRSNIYKYISELKASSDNKEITENIINFLKLLTIMDEKSIINVNYKYKSIFQDKDILMNFVEGMYGFWRKLERYTLIENRGVNEGIGNLSFLDASNRFSNLVLSTYRKIEENIEGRKPNVYRQLPAGGNVGVIVNNIKWNLFDEYICLKGIHFIDSVLIDPPFIIYPKKNTRDGLFSEVYSNPLKGCSIEKEHWYCMPVKVGELLAFIYFHRDFMGHGIALCNLFEMARGEEYENKKPDIVYVFGAKDNDDKVKTVFYDDTKNDIMLGYISYGEEIDYFGYMKKMTLTLHNLIMIKRGYLPIHGAMVNIITKNGKESNIIIMGDSGAGKSESLEAFRELSEDYISDMTIIFDDMGVVKLNGDDKPLGFGTEIGAFVRLDDLDPGYAFREIDRSIFMNPDKINARLVMPVATYNDIRKGYPIDLFLYANNYDDGEKLEFFSSQAQALPTFRNGARIAKGTTTEKGLVNTYFANPFGPVQKKEETDKLLVEYFSKFESTGVKIGQLRTCLGLKGKEKNGPMEAAKKLLEVVKSI
ncbi:phosphoenolpyruvate carboxykinase [Clostridium akagii]|uniref:phosphoenolpyruvate carboxykinase n=1 Tax=Clostridium akagii TaxID=91623 RepID=UPI00047DC3A3|nr:phosphoenolpyruvate carboxykinase [Clostridium akagii]